MVLTTNNISQILQLKSMAMDLFSTISDAVFAMKQYVWSLESIEDGVAFGRKVSYHYPLSPPVYIVVINPTIPTMSGVQQMQQMTVQTANVAATPMLSLSSKLSIEKCKAEILSYWHFLLVVWLLE